MCLIVAIVALMLAYNFFMLGEYLQGLGSVAVASFFFWLMIRNIQYVKKLKQEKKSK